MAKPLARQVSELELALAGSMSEDDLLTAITDAATLFGWRWHHVRRSDKALQQGHAGFPDLCLIRAGRIKFLELKSRKGELTADQWGWGHEMPPPSHAVEWRVVRPAALDDVIASLR